MEINLSYKTQLIITILVIIICAVASARFVGCVNAQVDHRRSYIGKKVTIDGRDFTIVKFEFNNYTLSNGVEVECDFAESHISKH